MKKNILKISKKYLVFREEAKDISDKIQNKAKKEKTLYLDFREVSFFSRSFIDELLNVINDLRDKKIAVRVINLKPQLEKFLQTVDKRKKEIKEEIAALNKG